MSLDTCRLAWASVDCAAVSSARSDALLSFPSTCPAVTRWPARTLTAATVPLTGNGTSACCAGLIVPTTLSVALTCAGVTVASR